MAATSAGALKAFIESLSLGVSVRRDRSADLALPAVTIEEEISLVLDSDGDFGTQDHSGRELCQVDIWQQWRAVATNAVTESYTLVPDLRRALHGGLLTASPTHCYGMRVVSSVRLLERDANTVHHALTVEIRRRL